MTESVKFILERISHFIDDPFFAEAAFVIFGFWIGSVYGNRKGRESAGYDCFQPFYAEGFHDGWVARHQRATLQDHRVHPDILRTLPGGGDGGAEIVEWMRNGDHMTFEDWRKWKVSLLNDQLNRGGS